jgi:hypothetical protein
MSNFLNINWRDLGKAVIMLFLTTFITGITTAIQAGHFPDGPQLLFSLKAGGLAALAYLLKNLFTNSNGTIGTQP